MSYQISFNEFKSIVRESHPDPEFIRFEVDDYRDEFVAITQWPETILSYSCAEELYTYSFNGGVGSGKSIDEAKAAFEDDYRLIQRGYELSRLS